MNRDLLNQLNTIANELENQGLQKEAIVITNVMQKIAQSAIQQRGKQYNPALKSEYDKFIKIQQQHNLDDNQIYYLAKGVYDANFANNFRAYLADQRNSSSLNNLQDQSFGNHMQIDPVNRLQG